MPTTPARHQGWRYRLGLILLTAGMNVPNTRAQVPPRPQQSDLHLPREWLHFPARPNDSAAGTRAPRPRFFRAPFGYLYEAPESELMDPCAFDSATGADEGRFQFCMGADNPHIDFRRPGDPGGVGYFKVQTLVPLWETHSVELSIGLQAVTPAGLEADGLADGQTVLSPTVVWFQDLGGPALQGFVCQHVPALGRTGHPLQRGWLYGLAVQQPLPGSLHLFIEALGRQRREQLPGHRVPSNWELLPGLHWRLSESCWMSGGVILPLGTTRLEPGLWQFTCRWQY